MTLSASLSSFSKFPSAFVFILTCVSAITRVSTLSFKSGSFTALQTLGANLSSHTEAVAWAESAIDGSIYITGTTRNINPEIASTLGSTLGPAISLGGQDIFLARYMPQSNQFIWVYRIGTTADDVVECLLLDRNSKSLYIGGHTFGDLPGAPKRSGQADIFVLKYDITSTQPRAAWPSPIVLGTAGAETVSALEEDMSSGESVIYAAGSTTGLLFGKKKRDKARSVNAVVFAFQPKDGNIVHSVQFGTASANRAKAIVITPHPQGPLFVSVESARNVGQYPVVNFHLFKFARNLTPKGDLLLQSFAQEQVNGFAMHPRLKNSLFVIGSSLLDQVHLYDVFIKRLTQPFDLSDIGSSSQSVYSVSPPDYTKRFGSVDRNYDYGCCSLFHKPSGAQLFAGYTAGKFLQSVSGRGILSPFIGAVDPTTGDIRGTAQLELPQVRSWMNIVAITLFQHAEDKANRSSSLLYLSRRENLTSTAAYLSVGSFGIPKHWLTPIKSENGPTTSTAPVDPVDRSNETQFPTAIVAGCTCAVVLLAGVIAAVFFCVRMRKQEEYARFYHPEQWVQATLAKGVGKIEGPQPSDNSATEA